MASKPTFTGIDMSITRIGFNQVRRLPIAHLGGVADPADTLIAAMTTPPSAGRETLIRDTIDDLVTAGLWDLIDALWFMAAADSQAASLNWKTPASFVLSPQSAPGFVADQGWIGNDVDDYINTGFVPSTHGVNYLLNSASFGFYSLTNVQNNGIDMGARAALNNSEARMLTRNASDVMATRINANSGFNVSSVTDSSGLFAQNRSASNAIQIYRNGSSIATGTNASTSVPPYAFYLLATNNADSPTSFSARRLSFAFIGASLNSTQHGDLNTIVGAYIAGL